MIMFSTVRFIMFTMLLVVVVVMAAAVVMMMLLMIMTVMMMFVVSHCGSCNCLVPGQLCYISIELIEQRHYSSDYPHVLFWCVCVCVCFFLSRCV